MKYYRYSISCIDNSGTLIGFNVYRTTPDILTVVEYIESTKGYYIEGMLVTQCDLEMPPIETQTTIILHE